MNKKRILLILLILAAIVVAGGFFWWRWQEYQEDKKFGEMTVGELLNFGILPKGFLGFLFSKIYWFAFADGTVYEVKECRFLRE